MFDIQNDISLSIYTVVSYIPYTGRATYGGRRLERNFPKGGPVRNNITTFDLNSGAFAANLCLPLAGVTATRLTIGEQPTNAPENGTI